MGQLMDEQALAGTRKAGKEGHAPFGHLGELVVKRRSPRDDNHGQVNARRAFAAPARASFLHDAPLKVRAVGHVEDGAVRI